MLFLNSLFNKPLKDNKLRFFEGVTRRETIKKIARWTWGNLENNPQVHSTNLAILLQVQLVLPNPIDLQSSDSNIYKTLYRKRAPSTVYLPLFSEH
jgi:hypothetical protein